ncbi:reverse transcriptase domain, reverse transcriptase zinc-binding domain protein [Tanacetum coccineum]
MNGSPSDEFGLERGIRQGDPLSPFMFILASKGLNVIVNEAVENDIFRGVKVGTNNVTVSHLQYADDNIFFGEWSKENTKALMCVLKCFEEVSGLRVITTKGDILKISKEVDGIGVEFTSSCIGVLGDGRNIRFWLDRWVDNRRLCDRFPRYRANPFKSFLVCTSARVPISFLDLATSFSSF